jgi:hypothetical protein
VKEASIVGLGPSIAVATLCCLLAVAAPAHSAFRWRLWEHRTIQSDSTATKSWRGLEPFETKRECQTAALREARLQYESLRRMGDPELHGWQVVVTLEFDFYIFSYECLPDTLDPRGPKGK